MVTDLLSRTVRFWQVGQTRGPHRNNFCSGTVWGAAQGPPPLWLARQEQVSPWADAARDMSLEDLTRRLSFHTPVSHVTSVGQLPKGVLGTRVSSVGSSAFCLLGSRPQAPSRLRR